MPMRRIKMPISILRWFASILICGWLTSGLALAQAASPVPAGKAEQTAVFSGGCFWGVDAVFKHVKGVSKVVSGYRGRNRAESQLRDGQHRHHRLRRIRGGHLRSVQGVIRSTAQVFFYVAHDPTELNRQGPDEGTQYRSMIFYTNEEQKHSAHAYIAKLDRAKLFPNRSLRRWSAAALLSRRGVPSELPRT